MEDAAVPALEEIPDPSTEEEPVNIVTLTFWPGEGEELSITQKTVQIGEPFGELPVPSKDDYVFEGWFTGIDSGEQVTELSICQKDKDLYAHWKRKVSLDDAEGLEITGIFNQQYSGNYVILAPVLKFDGIILQRDADYTVSYSNNLEPGTAQITFTGIGYYMGSVSRTFRILLPTPGLPVLNNIAGGVKISWTSVNNAAKYRVLRKNASGVWTKVADTTALSYTDKSVKSGTQYSYSICCMSTDSSQATSTYNKTGRTIRYIATPALPTAVNVAGGVKVTWTKVPGAAKYRVLRKTGTGTWAKVADTTSNTYTDKGVKSGTQYSYSICCMSSDGTKATSTYNKTGRAILYTAAAAVTQTGGGSSSGTKSQPFSGTRWVLNTNTKKIHYPSCSSASRIAVQNYATTDASVSSLKAQEVRYLSPLRNYFICNISVMVTGTE